MKSFFISYKNPLTAVLALIIMGGLFAYSKLPTALFPEITFPKIKIIADAGLQPVNKMMVTVTRPLEIAIKQVPDLQTIRSTTSRGSCEISAFMNWNANIDLSQQRIESRIAQIRNTLPPDVNISVEKMNPSILPVMGYTLESATHTPIEMRLLGEYTVRPFLSQVSGVSEVRVIGGKAKEYWVTLDQQKMAALSMTPDSISAAMTATNFVKSNGYLADYRMLYLTVTDATVHTISDLQQVVIRNDGRRIVTLRDIASVGVHEATEYIRINANGRDGLLIAVIKQPNANLITLSDAMRQKIADLQQLLPKDVAIRPYYVQADFVQDAVRSVSDSLWIGLLLAIVVAVIFLRSVKASATILITIPLTLCLTLIVLNAIGYSLNIMTLGAVAAAIGLIIDDAIVVVEQIHRTHEEHPGEPTAILLQQAISYLFPAMLGSSMSTIVIFVPFLLMTGVAGAYFKVMTNTMIIALVCSFFVTWIGLPVIYLLLTRRKPKAKQAKTETVHSVHRQRWVAWFIRRPVVSIAIAGIFIAGIVLILPHLETGFLPEMDEGSIVMDYTSPPGTSMEETDRMLQQIEKLIRAHPDVQAYSRRTGTQMGFFITEPNTGDYLIQLRKKHKETTEEVTTDLRKAIESSQPALRVDFGQVIGDMLGDLMSSVQPVEIKIFGNDQVQLNALSKQVAEVVSGVKGTADVFNGIVIAGPSISVAPDYGRLAQFGVTPTALQYQLQTALEGNIVGSVLEKEQQTPIRIVYTGNRKVTAADISLMQIAMPDGRLQPINQLASVTINTGDAEVKRENLQAQGIVTARLEGRGLGSVMSDVKANIAKQIALPQGYHIEYGGSYADQQQSFRELLMILITSSLLVFGVILFLFRDYRVAALIISLAVLGIAGSYLALFVTHTPLNVGSYTGLIMIVGIIGENSIFTFLQFREELQRSEVDDAIIYSISTRLRPKLMTALGAIIALMPLALGIGTGSQLHQPLAIAVIGGFLAALPLLLIVLPTFLRWIYRGYKRPVRGADLRA